jgi:hypothetical protein
MRDAINDRYNAKYDKFVVEEPESPCSPSSQASPGSPLGRFPNREQELDHLITGLVNKLKRLTTSRDEKKDLEVLLRELRLERMNIERAKRGQREIFQARHEVSCVHRNGGLQHTVSMSVSTARWSVSFQENRLTSLRIAAETAETASKLADFKSKLATCKAKLRIAEAKLRKLTKKTG